MSTRRKAILFLQRVLERATGQLKTWPKLCIMVELRTSHPGAHIARRARLFRLLRRLSEPCLYGKDE